MTEKLLLSDPVGALVEYLSSHTLIQDAGRCQYVTAPLLTQQSLPIDTTLPPALALKASGLGSGQGHAEQAQYASMRIDCMNYGKTDFEAWRLGLLSHKAILSARRKQISYTHDGIDYETLFVAITQSGGPAPLRDQDTDWPAVLYVYNIEAS